MPNLLLTNVCNRNCAYCFALAQIEVGTARRDWEINQEELDIILDYLDPRWDMVSLLGGEPTMHSRFGELAGYIADKGFGLKVFTNGCTEHLLELLDIDNVQVMIILNYNDPESYTPDELDIIKTNFKAFGKQLSLSFNVFQPIFNWEFLRRAILDMNLSHTIRLGVAQPIVGMSNEYLRGKGLRQAYKNIVAMAESLADDGISLGFDCGFQACMFTEQERGVLAECGTRFLFQCQPVLDIGMNLNIWRCFPFSVLKGCNLRDFESLEDVRRYFNNIWSAEQAKGNTSSCPSCESMLMGSCRGGCLSRTLNNQMETPHA